MGTLKDSFIINLKNSDIYIKEYQACGLNSILAILEHLGYINKVDINDLKVIFDYDHEGIRDERYIFNKFNTYLKQKEVPYSFSVRKFESIQDIHKNLSNNIPIPVFFWLKVLDFTRKHYKNEYQLDFGDIHRSDVKHVLLFVGYKSKGDEILFIDPSYQMPWISKNEKDLLNHYFKLDKKDFYECIKQIKAFIEVKYLKTEAKKYNNKRKEQEKQEKLK